MSDTVEQEREVRERVFAAAALADDLVLRQETARLHPADIAEILDQLDDDNERLSVFSVLDDDRAAEVISDVGESARAALLARLADAHITTLLEGLDSDDAADLLGELPEDRKLLLLHRADPETRRDVQGLLSYPDDSAGGLMKTEVASVDIGTTVRQVRTYLRQHRDDFHDIHNVFITDHKKKLVGYVPVRNLVMADDGSSVDEILLSDLVSVSATVDQEEVAHLFEKYDLLSLPVVDASELLVGRITVDDVVDVIEEEATEDMLKMAGVGDEPLGLHGPVKALRTRLPWLGLNLMTATVSAAAISLFQETIHQVAIAAAFMTVVASQGGNAGVQTMTLVVRGLVLGELSPHNTRRIVMRELTIALLNGTVLGSVAAATVYAWTGNVRLASVMATAMIINMLIAAALGTLVPMGLRRLGADPAVASSVFVTAGTDLLGFLVFLGLLSVALGI